MRRKISFYDFYNLNINFYKTVSYFDNKENMRCVGYFLTNKLNDSQLKGLKQFKNIKILKSRSEYAPQLENTVVFIYEKILKIED